MMWFRLSPLDLLRWRKPTSLALGLALFAGSAVAQDAAHRGIRIAVVPHEVRATEHFDASESAGLFVGIRHFDDAAFAEVPYAADDAVDLAHLFAVELELIAPAQVVLSLAGEPQKLASRERLRALLAAGAASHAAEQSDIYRLLADVGRASGTRGLFVVALATHGFSDQGTDFLVASDSLRRRITRTGVAVTEVFDDVARAAAPRRLVLLDACRERLFPSRAVGGEAMSRSFADAIVRASGQVVRTEADKEGFSHGVDDLWSVSIEGVTWRHSGGEEYPVVHVSWNDAKAFCAWLSLKTGERIRLPTEAEWEYAARAGTVTATYAGDLTLRGDCDAPELDEIAWYCGTSDGASHPVGRKRANDWRLHDMLGNVWEWVEDAAEEEGISFETSTYDRDVDDPLSTRGSLRVIRGGSWNFWATESRAAIRYAHPPDYRDYRLGFRLVRTAD